MTAQSEVAPARADPIGALMPWTGPEERTLRNKLLRAQQRSATRALNSGSQTARSIFWLINHTAGESATARSSIADLRELIAGLTRLFLVGDMYERREAPREH